MADFLKMKDAFTPTGDDTATLTIQPLTVDGEERFSYWSVAEKKFYNEGANLSIDGVTKKVEEWKYVRLSDDQKKRYARNLKIQRNALVDGTEVIVSLTMTAEEKLKAAMSIVQQMDEDPLDYRYNIVRKKTGPEPINVEYEVTLGGNAKKKGGKTPPKAEIDFDIEADGEVILTEREEKVVTAIKKKVPDYSERDVDYLDKLLKKNIPGLTDSRSNDIVNAYLR